MEITKVAGLSEEEKTALIKAGEIIGSINKALESKEIDTLTEETTRLLTALNNVIKTILEK